MPAPSESLARIVELEARQEDVLRQLEELERRIDAVLAEYAPATILPARPALPAALAPAVKAA